MPLPIVAIVGRPNVGKSSLFNRLARRRISIVEATPGVTRDRVCTIIRHDGVYLELIDTGGYGIEDTADLTEHVAEQIRFALDSAAVIIFVVDILDGLVSLDEEVARLLRGCDRPVILAANKADAARFDTDAGQFHKLGFGPPLTVSAMHGRAIDQLRQRITETLPDQIDQQGADEPAMKLAVVGKRNVGKSTFINCLARQQRMIVSEVAGTTRDSVDVRFEKDGRTFVAIDTAGLRKKSKLADDIEFYSYSRATRSIRRADVVMFLIDATLDIGSVDKKLARYITDNFKPCVIVINKWDLARGKISTQDYHEYLEKVMPAMPVVPICFTTAQQDRNVQSAVDLAIELFKQASTRVSTAQLNKALQTVLARRGPGSPRGGKFPKIYYSTQTSVSPPEIVLFVNDPKLFSPTYHRYLINHLRDLLPFSEVPLKLTFRPHRESRKPPAGLSPSDSLVEAAALPAKKPSRRPSKRRPRS